MELPTLAILVTLAHCAAFAAPVLDGSGIRIEFDSEERGFDCLSIKNKLSGKDVQFGDGTVNRGDRFMVVRLDFAGTGMYNAPHI